jgi:hypothetical protein
MGKTSANDAADGPAGPMPPEDRNLMLPESGDAVPGWSACVGLLFMVSICLLMIVFGVWGVLHRSFEWPYRHGRRVHITGVSASVMASTFIFMGLAGLRWLWTLRLGETAALDDTLLRILLILIAVAMGGGFLLFVLSIPF